MNSVAVIGAGITGLTAAFYLKRRGIPVALYESSARVGGVIQSLQEGGYLAEFGPNTILETSPKITQLIRDAGLESRRLDPDPKSEARYVVRYKRPIAMPSSPAGFFTTDLFSVRAKIAVLREPFVPRRRHGDEESIAQFVVRRLNREFLDQAIDALVAGIYAGDPWKLSVTQAFPRLAQLEERYGSLIKGQLFGARERKKRGEVAKDRAAKFSFDDGLQVLPDSLRDQLGDSVHLNTSVVALNQTGNGWDLDLRSHAGETRASHRAAIYAGTAHNLATLKINRAGSGTDGPKIEPFDLNVFSEIRYPPVASVVLGFRREDVDHPCQGFGMLIPKVEGFRILGTLFSSSLFPNRAPAGHITLTSYIGGERSPELASLPPEKLYALTCEDLRVILGVRGKPTFQHCVFYRQAIPQYNIGYGRYRDFMSDLESSARGLFFAGHYRNGISLGDCIVSGHDVVERAVDSGVLGN
ncbi:MAG TPA: protoporphyrinogen oxidase [Verrucomicrobiae bacterium]|nr:protoporphyrinogen oxidase [Verrucomicrobiae bacterium]